MTPLKIPYFIFQNYVYVQCDYIHELIWFLKTINILFLNIFSNNLFIFIDTVFLCYKLLLHHLYDNRTGLDKYQIKYHYINNIFIYFRDFIWLRRPWTYRENRIFYLFHIWFFTHTRLYLYYYIINELYIFLFHE
jgi:hypothetical protein